MNIERCFICDNPTGRAGIVEDSLYDKAGCGPYCEPCWDESTNFQAVVYEILPSTLKHEK